MRGANNDVGNLEGIDPLIETELTPYVSQYQQMIGYRCPLLQDGPSIRRTKRHSHTATLYLLL